MVPIPRHHRDAAATFYGWNDIWLDPDFREWNIEGCLPAIDCPTLLIQGRDDEYGTLAQIDVSTDRSGCWRRSPGSYQPGRTSGPGSRPSAVVTRRSA